LEASEAEKRQVEKALDEALMHHNEAVQAYMKKDADAERAAARQEAALADAALARQELGITKQALIRLEAEPTGVPGGGVTTEINLNDVESWEVYTLTPENGAKKLFMECDKDDDQKLTHLELRNYLGKVLLNL